MTTVATSVQAEAAASVLDDDISIGLSTQAGIIAALIAFILAIIAFVSGNRSEETIGALVTGAVILYGVIRGRMEQAAAITVAKAEIATKCLVRG